MAATVTAAEGGDMTDIRAERRRVRVRDIIAKLSKKEEVVNVCRHTQLKGVIGYE